MAFVYRAERDSTFIPPNPNRAMGPGAYVGHKDYKVKPK